MAGKEDSSVRALARPLGTPPVLYLGSGLVVSRIGAFCTAVWKSGSTVQWAGKPEYGPLGPLDAFVRDVELTRAVVHEPNTPP
jgi:hypothetical protein